LDTEQYTVNDDVSSPVWFGYRETSGTGNIPSAFVELWQEEDGAGTITGPWIYLYDSGTSTVMFEVDVAGNVKPHGTFQPPSLADSAAPNNSIYYSTDASKLVYKDSGGSVHNLY